ENFIDGRSGRKVEWAIDRDDAVKGADGVAGERLHPGLMEIGAERYAARVGVLDDRDRRFGEFSYQLEGGVGVRVVVVGQLLALQLPRGRDPGPLVAGAVERRLLVRVLAVAGFLDQLGGADQRLGKHDALVLGK